MPLSGTFKKFLVNFVYLVSMRTAINELSFKNLNYIQFSLPESRFGTFVKIFFSNIHFNRFFMHHGWQFSPYAKSRGF